MIQTSLVCLSYFGITIISNVHYIGPFFKLYIFAPTVIDRHHLRTAQRKLEQCASISLRLFPSVAHFCAFFKWAWKALKSWKGEVKVLPPTNLSIITVDSFQQSWYKSDITQYVIIKYNFYGNINYIRVNLTNIGPIDVFQVYPNLHESDIESPQQSAMFVMWSQKIKENKQNCLKCRDLAPWVL